MTGGTSQLHQFMPLFALHIRIAVALALGDSLARPEVLLGRFPLTESFRPIHPRGHVQSMTKLEPTLILAVHFR